MDYLNYYSLSKKISTTNQRTYSSKELFSTRGATYNFLFIFKNKIIMKGKNPFFIKTKNISKNLLRLSLSLIINLENNFYILCNLKEKEIQTVDIFKNCNFLNIREALLNLKQEHASLVSAGYSLCRWQNNNKYCGSCGFKTKLDDNGNL